MPRESISSKNGRDRQVVVAWSADAEYGQLATLNTSPTQDPILGGQFVDLDVDGWVKLARVARRVARALANDDELVEVPKAEYDWLQAEVGRHELERKRRG